jgi:hypothetical protein
MLKSAVCHWLGDPAPFFISNEVVHCIMSSKFYRHAQIITKPKAYIAVSMLFHMHFLSLPFFIFVVTVS